MKRLWYKSDRPEGGVLLALAFAAVLAAWTWQYAHSEPVCPPTTPDGRPLRGLDLRKGKYTCLYAPLPRPAVELSPTELRRMARQKEIMK